MLVLFSFTKVFILTGDLLLDFNNAARFVKPHKLWLWKHRIFFLDTIKVRTVSTWVWTWPTHEIIIRFFKVRFIFCNRQPNYYPRTVSHCWKTFIIYSNKLWEWVLPWASFIIMKSSISINIVPIAEPLFNFNTEALRVAKHWHWLSISVNVSQAMIRNIVVKPQGRHLVWSVLLLFFCKKK
jgi:hypothetical protein